MKELDFLEIINKTLSQNAHIGDDCAYIKELGIVITHDSLVEDIHFSQKYSTPYQIGYKAIAVNLSDIFASGAIPKYLTISISMPSNTDKIFISEFYKACDDLSKKYDFEIVGGDITGAEKLFISVCAIGLTANRKISSRSNANVGDFVITTGNHGSSAAGLWLLQNNKEFQDDKFLDLTQTHLLPVPQKTFSDEISQKLDAEYAMMDSSDGLADALYKIAKASNVSIEIDFDKIPYDKTIEDVAKSAKIDFKDWILYGGEDFQLVACVNEESLKKLDKSLYTIIGKVIKQEKNILVKAKIGNEMRIIDLEKSYNHFKGEKK